MLIAFRAVSESQQFYLGAQHTYQVCVAIDVEDDYDHIKYATLIRIKH